MRRALQNLIDNAIKYANGSHLRIEDADGELRIEDADGELRLAVEDDGAGCSAVKWRSTQGIALEASVYARLRAQSLENGQMQEATHQNPEQRAFDRRHGKR